MPVCLPHTNQCSQLIMMPAAGGIAARSQTGRMQSHSLMSLVARDGISLPALLLARSLQETCCSTPLSAIEKINLHSHPFCLQLWSGDESALQPFV